MTFLNRAEAGRALAGRLAHLAGERPVVLALPRGGVPVGFEIALRLGAPLDLLLVRKLGAPGMPELAIGALVEGTPPEMVLNERILRELRVSDAWLAEEAERQRAEITRRRAAYLGARRPPVPLEGRTAVVVDDGVATGATIRAALRGLAARSPRRIVLAVPVAQADLAEALRGFCDEAVILEAPHSLGAVGLHYGDFTQTGDAEVVALLGRAADGF
ncbi:phosphoribosyltransferase [Muricoccus pecuniae]|uniref:Putative phosphoribosyl transferase n=1 Tax=Muricoccus pecuniae TaxID=693023 RepID=A0A840YBZ6_9PROT|nr:phosphoribosyltransferase family protein [Roseomonas pecuniae]MBB5693877.1 putative phosphoribosyl transferase [Roseomonas pecuniae]